MFRCVNSANETDENMLKHFLSLWPGWQNYNAANILSTPSWKLFVKSRDISSGGEEIIACLIFSVVSPTAEVIDLYVLPSSRKQGIAKHLFMYATAQLNHLDKVSEIILEVRPSNKPARSLYQSLGFLLIAERKKYYSDGENAMILRKDLSH